MKKLMIAACALCMAAVAQAASIGWTYQVSWLAIDENNYAPGTVYVFAGDSSAATTMAKALATDGMSALTGYLDYGTNSEEEGIVLASGSGNRLEYTDENKSVSLYSVVIDPTGEKFTLGYGETLPVTDAYITDDSVTFYSDEFYTGDPSGWTTIGGDTPIDTPEPTSGLLLLLGVAGLALRRRRA